MFKFAVVTKLNVEHVLFTLRSRALLARFRPQLSHLLESCFRLLLWQLLHELETTNNMTVGLVRFLNFVKDIVVSL